MNHNVHYVFIQTDNKAEKNTDTSKFLGDSELICKLFETIQVTFFS